MFVYVYVFVFVLVLVVMIMVMVMDVPCLPSNLTLAWHHLSEWMQDACNMDTGPAAAVAFRDLKTSC